MSDHLVVYRSAFFDPFLNLAIEDHLLRNRPLRERALLLYLNSPAVVIGRHQNPWVECNPEHLERSGIALVRRQSGGGTVYHDPGNLNFSILCAREEYDQDANFAIVIEALAALGIEAERSGRNDLVSRSYKISGSAFKHLRERSFHHGTVLVDADLRALSSALKPAALEITSRGIASVRSRVANVVDLLPAEAGAAAGAAGGATADAPAAPAEAHANGLIEALSARLAEAFARRWAGSGEHGRGAPRREIDDAFLAAHPEIRERAAEYRRWDWVFGKTPRFEEIAQCSGGEVRIAVEHGLIAAIEAAGEHSGERAAGRNVGNRNGGAAARPGAPGSHGAPGGSGAVDAAATVTGAAVAERPLRALIGSRYRPFGVSL